MRPDACGAEHVAVVVLTWNGLEDTRRCLRSLDRVPYKPLTLVVVDNGSTDGTAEAIAREFPRVELVRNERNLGFAGGNNAGIVRALALGADHVVILNNDTEADPNFVAALVGEARRRPDVGALCSKILFADPPDLVWFAGLRLDARRGYNGRILGYREPDDGRFAAVTETDAACAAAMLVPRAVVERVGLLDADLFLYAEDTDWSLRAKTAGLRLFVVPDSKVWHRVSAASGGENSPTTLYYTLRNMLTVLERHAPLGALGTRRRRAVVLGAHTLQALRWTRRGEALRAVAAGWRDFHSGRLGPRGG